MNKILIVNRGFCDNVGDQAINRSMTKLIEESCNAKTLFADYTSRSNNYKVIEKKNSNNYVNYQSAREIFKKILPLNLIWLLRNFLRVKKSVNNEIDLVVIGGGQLLLSNRFSIASATWVLMAKYYNVKVVFCGIGSGTEFSYINKKLVSLALKNSDGICVRDKVSQEILRTIFSVSSELAGDVVFTDILKVNQSKNNNILLGIPELGVYNEYNNIISREQYYSLWIKFVRESEFKLNDCVLYYTTEADYIESLLFKKYIDNKYQIKLNIVECNTLELLNEEFLKYKYVISGRMHGLILAINNGANIRVFPISKKLESFNDIITSKKFNIKDYKDAVREKTVVFLHSILSGDDK